LIQEERSKHVPDHWLCQVHVTSFTGVEEHSARFVESLESDPVLLVALLFLHQKQVTTVVPETEPFRLFRNNCFVLYPQEKTEVLDGCEALFEVRVLEVFVLVVDVGQEQVVVVESLEVPPRPVVIGGCTPILNESELCKVAEDVIGKRAPPALALLIDGHAHMGASICEESVHLQAFALLDHCSSNESTLGDADDAYLLACEVRVVMDLVACGRHLPVHPLEY